MATKRIRNFQRMRDFLEEKDLYFPGMSYEAMKKAEAEYKSDLDENQLIKSSLESMGLLEKGMSSDEMKELYNTLNVSLVDSNVSQEINYEESIELAISESEKEFCRNSTMLNSIEEHEENWDEIDEIPTNSAIEDTESSTIINIVKAEVHRQFNWDPEEDLHQKLEIIALNESKYDEKRTRSDSGIISDARSIDFIEEVDPPGIKKEKRFPCKRKTSFSSWADLTFSH
ncbi:hypothetical protein ACFFRR_009481 [Megaselia abdita]